MQAVPHTECTEYRKGKNNNNRLKKWLNGTFWGVATKYMQDYLNWFKVKETVLKFCNDQADELLGLSMSHYNVKFATV